MSLLSRYTTTLYSLLDEVYSYRPMYNSKSRFVSLDNKTGKLEIELAGYSSSEIKVYTEENLLAVTANKSDKSRTYHYTWYISENERVDDVKYENGLLTISISVVEPESPTRKFYQIN